MLYSVDFLFLRKARYSITIVRAKLGLHNNFQYNFFYSTGLYEVDNRILYRPGTHEHATSDERRDRNETDHIKNNETTTRKEAYASELAIFQPSSYWATISLPSLLSDMKDLLDTSKRPNDKIRVAYWLLFFVSIMSVVSIIRNSKMMKASEQESEMKSVFMEMGNSDLQRSKVTGEEAEKNTPATKIAAAAVSFRNNQPICQTLASQNSNSSTILSASSLWMDHLDDILEASRHPKDVKFEQKDFVHRLLLDLRPSLLQTGLVSRMKHSEVERIVNILRTRKNNPKAPPLQILVMGGSVTEGVGCEQSKEILGRQCTWSVRLESMLNALLGFNGVQVTNVANGGTHTEQALQLVKYWLYPASVLPKGPDIIIHAFGANDSHLDAHQTFEWEYSRVLEIFQQSLQRLVWFHEQVHESAGCGTAPVVFHLDDYIGGHSQGNILGDLTFKMVMTVVAQWYQSLAVSSADVVRRIVYADTKELNFSPKWRLQRKNKSRYAENCHFNWPGHQMITWVWAYSFLDALVTYCQQEDQDFMIPQGHTSSLTQKSQQLLLHNNPNLLPPGLTDTLQLEDVSKKWMKKHEESLSKNECSTDRQQDQQSPCSFAFTSGQEGQTQNPTKLNQYLRPFVKKRGGWNAETDLSAGWARKLGLVAKKPSATLELDVKNITQVAKTLTVHSIKSYGDKWKDSEVRVQAYILGLDNSTDANVTTTNNTDIAVVDSRIDGIHNSTSSITYTTKFDFPQTAPIGSTVRIVVTLVGGTTFKIMGMMLCNR